MLMIGKHSSRVLHSAAMTMKCKHNGSRARCCGARRVDQRNSINAVNYPFFLNWDGGTRYQRRDAEHPYETKNNHLETRCDIDRFHFGTLSFYIRISVTSGAEATRSGNVVVAEQAPPHRIVKGKEPLGKVGFVFPL